MATKPTNLPVPSESPRDLKFNAGKIDEFVTSMARQYIDRFGSAHYTIEGIRWVAQQAIAAFGYITLDSFEDGNTLTLPNQVLRLEATGEYYRWDGVFPKDVPTGSTPQTTGGVGVGAWLSVGDTTARQWVAVNFTESPFKKTGMFNSGVTVSSKNDAMQYTDGLWYVWTGALPHTISSSETPDVETTKWACVGLLNGYRINEVKNFIEEPGITNDSPAIKLAIYSLVRIGYGELIVTANSKINIITEVAIPFAIDGIPVSIGIRGEGVINSLGNVPEIRVGLNSRGIVFGNVCYSLDRLVISQYVGSENTDVISKTSNTITLASNPFQANGGNIITWPLTDNNTAGVPVSNFCQFSTNSGAFFATGLVNNSDGSCTLTGVTGCNGTPSSEISNITKVVRFTSRAHQLPDDTYPRTATCISLDVIENPTISNLWVLQTYRTFSFKDGNGGGEGSGLGHYGLWNDIIVDGTKEFVGGTDLSGGSIQGIEGGQFVNIHLFGTKYGFRGRRMKSCMFSNCTHYAFTGGKIFDILEFDGFSWVGGS